MRAAAGDAMETALRALKLVANDPKADVDVRARAATELGKLALQILTKTRSGGDEGGGESGGKGDQPDLFDKPKDMGPWKLSMVK